MKTDMQNTTAYIVKHPVISGVFGVFALAALTGFSIFAFTLVQPTVSDAFSEGPPCCDGGGFNWDTWHPNPWITDGSDTFGGGGGGGTPSPIIPACTLSVVPGTVTQGDPVSITWTSVNAVAANIDNGIGAVSSANGSVNNTPSGDTTYTMTVVSATGHTATCSDSVVVEPPVVNTVPACTLTAGDLTLTSGETTDITWTTTNATSVQLQHLDAITPGLPLNGSVTTGAAGTYTLTASDDDGDSVTCSVTIEVTTPPDSPVCTLVANPTIVTLGGASELTWTTTNGSTFHIGGGVGSVTPVVGGSVFVTPSALGEYTYVGVVTSGTGETATCSASVTVVPPVVNSPVCTLDINPSTITLGGSAQIEWTTQHGDTFSIDNGVGSIPLLTTPNAGGTKNITPTVEGTITYTGTVTSVDGQTATCSDTVQVLPVGVDAPSCTLTTDGLGIGETETTIYWTITNAVSATLNKYTVAPTDGSKTVGAGTYTLTVVNAEGVEVICGLVIESPPEGPACTFVADDTTLTPGQETTLTWTTTNATEVHLRHLDAITPDMDLNGSITTQALGLYTLTAFNDVGETVECTVTLTRVVVPPGLACTLQIDRDSMRTGESAEMTWTTNEAVSFTINGAAKDLNGNETIRPAGVQTHTYTGIATNDAGETVECSDSVQVTGGSGGGGLSCSMSFTKSVIRSGETSELQWSTRRADTVEIDRGIGSVALTGTETVTETAVGTHEYVLTAKGNGDTAICRATLTVSGGSGGCTSNCGGGSTSPNVTIDFLKEPGLQPLAFVTLSQIPYTGLELGSVGTTIYWIILIIWSGAVAYLVLFKLLPYIGRKLKTVGSAVTEALDATEESTIDTTMHEEMEDIQMDGFAPKANNDEALSVEDIVRGLSRMHQEQAPVEAATPVISVEEEEPVIYEEEVVEEMARPPVEAVAPAYAAPSVDGDDIRLLNALMSGDRDTSFSMLRRTVRNGGRPELLLEKALVHLDTAYRARVDGIACSEDVRRICAQADTALLEEIINALATAVDTTYSQAQTGAKLALTRAHAVIERG